jgi:hypothetical protein
MHYMTFLTYCKNSFPNPSTPTAAPPPPAQTQQIPAPDPKPGKYFRLGDTPLGQSPPAFVHNPNPEKKELI